MKPSRPILAVRQLRIERGGTVILDGIDWSVAPGQHWVVLGANGSGKTSLLSALTGYLMPTAGAISVLGHTYGESDWRELRRRIGIVSSAIRQRMADDEPALDTVISGRHAMIELWGRTTAGERRTARRLLEQIECAALADRPWRVLSQGERQRVLIGRALMARPRLLILDEPCAGLDPAAREHFLQFLERLGRQPKGPALVLVTHHVEEITLVFSHALVLRQGRVLAAGELTRVLTSATLTKAFAALIRLRKTSGRHTLQVAANRGVVI